MSVMVFFSLFQRCLHSMLRHWPDTTRAGFMQGMAAILPSAPAIGAWGLVTGMAMAQASLSVPQAIGMALLVFAGSAQLAALPLIALGLPIWIVLLTATLVNLRFVIFSASLQPHFAALSWYRRMVIGYLNGDLHFALFAQRYPYLPSSIGKPEAGQEGYFYGLSLTNWVSWQVGSLTGILLASQVPAAWGLGFAGTLALLVILLPMMVNGTLVLVAGVAGSVAWLAAGLPYKLNLVLAVLVAMLAGTVADGIRTRCPLLSGGDRK